MDEGSVENKFYLRKYTGSIESYNDLVSKNYADPEKFIISFVDKDFNQTNLFTGWFKVFNLGLLYKPGDLYIYHEDRLK